VARILLVDDDKDIRELGHAILANAGHDVFAVDGAISALEFLRSHSVDIIITDANMPRHSGFDLLRTLKRDPQHSRDTSLVMLTGRRERRDIERAVQLGVHDYIVKPLDPMLFLQKVTDLLERRPPGERAQADFSFVQLNLRAQASVAIELVSISEVGLVIRSIHRLLEGSTIKLESDLFTKMDISHPTLRVLSSAAAGDAWDIRLAFVGVDERTLTKVRSWVHRNTTRNKHAA
jgi:CheY-like chemotaxis protein